MGKPARQNACLFGLILILLYGRGVSAAPGQPPYPNHLSEWQVFVRNPDGSLELSEGVFPYELVNPLFSDYAVKFRFVRLPRGQAARYREKGPFVFPVGTVLGKTFAYPADSVGFPDEGGGSSAGVVARGPMKVLNSHRLVETRLLVKTDNGWIGLPYVWNQAQSEASLALIGVKIPVSLTHPESGTVSFSYRVPNFNQCKGCHIIREGFSKSVVPIGPRAAYLNKNFRYPEGLFNQLSYWSSRDLLRGLPEKPSPAPPRWDDPAAPLDARARAYLDINCAHCHNPKGPAAYSGLFLDQEDRDPVSYGVCKSPVASGTGSGGRQFDIVPGHPEQSILHYRLGSGDPGEMMPELGRSLAHVKGLELIYSWIAGMDGSCGNG